MRTIPLAVLAVLLTTGCSSVFQRSQQRVEIFSIPTHANIEVKCGDAPRDGGRTPATVTIDRSAEECELFLTKEGYDPKRVVFERKETTAYWMNGALGVPIGAVFALATWIMLPATDGIDERAAGSAFRLGLKIGGAPGMAIDRATGYAWYQYPGKVDVKLNESEAPTAAAAPPR